MQACIEKPEGRREPTRILLAHSDREIAQEIKRTLVALCPNVTVVTNGRGAAEKIKLGYFYMLVTGWQLPEFHAAQLIHILRSGRFLFAPRVVIIVYTPESIAELSPWATTVDVQLVATTEINQLPKAVEAAISKITKPTVLVIEDDERSAETARACLAPWFSVDIAATADAGLNAFRTGRYDVVLLDLMLPDASGDTVLRAIKTTHPLQPVIVVTANSNPEAQLPFPFDATLGLIAKPYNVTRLRTACHHAIAGALGDPSCVKGADDIALRNGLMDEEWEDMLASIQ